MKISLMMMIMHGKMVKLRSRFGRKGRGETEGSVEREERNGKGGTEREGSVGEADRKESQGQRRQAERTKGEMGSSTSTTS